MKDNKRLKRRVRNSYIVSTVSMALVLFLLGSVGYLMTAALRVARTLQESVTVTVELADGVDSLRRGEIERRLRGDEMVRDIEFVSKQTKIGDAEFRHMFENEIEEVLGENPQTAKYAGMNVTKILILAVLISGGICGLAGMIQATGNEGRLANDISAGLGFTAIITAWLAKLSAPMILVSSFLFAVLLQGGSYLQVAMSVPASVSEVIQGVILFFVLASEFFTSYRIVRVKRGKENV